MQLSHNIHNEREACAELLVQIKLQEQMPQMMETLAQAGLRQTKVTKETRTKTVTKGTGTKTVAKETGQKTVIDTEQKVITRQHPPKERPGSKDLTMKQKRVAIIDEPITERTPDADVEVRAEVKNENTNSNASPEVIEDSSRVAGSERKDGMPERQIEETAL